MGNRFEDSWRHKSSMESVTIIMEVIRSARNIWNERKVASTCLYLLPSNEKTSAETTSTAVKSD